MDDCYDAGDGVYAQHNRNSQFPTLVLGLIALREGPPESALGEYESVKPIKFFLINI